MALRNMEIENVGKRVQKRRNQKRRNQKRRVQKRQIQKSPAGPNRSKMKSIELIKFLDVFLN